MIVNGKIYIGCIIRMIWIRFIWNPRIKKRIITPPTAVVGPKWRTRREEDTLLIARHVILCLAVVICLTIFLRGYNKQQNAFRQRSSTVPIFGMVMWSCVFPFCPFFLLFFCVYFFFYALIFAFFSYANFFGVFFF